MTEQAQQWKHNDRVEWSPTEGSWLPGTVLVAQGESAVVNLDEGETLPVRSAHLRRLGEGQAA